MDTSQVKRIAVIGAGLMGHGIALEFAVAGYQVRLHDLNEDRLGTALANIRANLQRLSTLGRLERTRIDPALAAITTSTDLGRAVAGAELVIEAIVEDLGAKHTLLRALEPLCGDDTLIASNTSSFMPSRLAEAVSRPEPAPGRSLFQSAVPDPPGRDRPGTGDQRPHDRDHGRAPEEVGKVPVVLRKEATGFVGNRLQFALFREALAIVEQGIAGPEAVDEVVRFGFGRRLAAAGPFEVFDLAGLDTIAAVAAEIFPELATAVPAGQRVPDLLSRKVRQGELGVKSGRGFHEWTAGEDRGAESTADPGPRPGGRKPSSGIGLGSRLQC